MSFKRETEIAEILISYLKKNGWEIYQEVLILDRVLDILAIKNGKYWAIECKNAINLEVFEQAYYWQHYFDYISICTPHPKPKYKRKLSIAKTIAKKLEIGFFVVSINKNCKEIIKAKKKDAKLKSQVKIFEEQKTYAKAGSKNGYFTPFKKTCQNLENYVKDNPGTSLKDAILNIDHHYKNTNSAFFSLQKLLMSGQIQTGFYALFEGKSIKLYPKIS